MRRVVGDVWPARDRENKGRKKPKKRGRGRASAREGIENKGQGRV
jgi:hypothetical protein